MSTKSTLSTPESLTLEVLKSPIEMQLEDDASDEEKLIIETPKKVSRKKKITISPGDKKLLEDIESDIEDALDAKAARTNLKNVQVKHILKQVFSNEDVLAFVKHAENPSEEYTVQYEPKITRARAKELSLQPIKLVDNSDDEPSETQVLINQELPEDDSSEDEYVPVHHEEESEDELNSSMASDSASIGTPNRSADCGTQTNWTEDGAFKIPAEKSTASTPKSKSQVVEEANIARRTRSKLCLSNTPLEDIEQSFVPPDITKDMYEMDYECDEDWMNFLTEFTRPLHEVVKPQDDDPEDHDPEYNVLAEVEEEDVEERREDKSVRISQKELNDLIKELVNYADNYDNFFPNDDQGDDADKTETDAECSSSQITLTDAEIVILDYNQLIMHEDQKALFEQQMRHHVQLLAQGFLLTHQHPELDLVSPKYKTYLDDLKEVSAETSFYANSNIAEAVDIVHNWEDKLQCNNPVINEYKQHLRRTVHENQQAKAAGLVYTPKFPKLLLETISRSKVFLYASFLPRVPYTEANPKVYRFTSHENEIIALGLEQFIPFLQTNSRHLKANGDVKLRDVSYYIQKYMMPSKDVDKLFKHICCLRAQKDENPVRLYFEKKIVWPTSHYVIPLSETSHIPPCKRNPNELPYQWREHIHPDTINVSVSSTQPITKVTKPPVYNKKFVRRRQPQVTVKTTKSPKPKPLEIPVKNASYDSFLTRNDLCASTPKCKKSLFKLVTPGVRKYTIPEALLKVKFNSSIFSNTPSANMMPSMPCLDADSNTTSFVSEASDISETSKTVPDTSVSEVVNCTQSTEAATSAISAANEEIIEVSSSTSIDSEYIDSTVAENTLLEEKDNLDDINALVVASSTIKSAAKRRPTGLEKKRAKMKRDFADNLRLLTEEDGDVIKEKRDRFIQAFYDKVQDTLSMEDFHKFMAVLNDFDEQQTSPKILYNQVGEIMANKHPDIMDEFLLFFDSLQARTLGKLVPYLMMSNMSLFLRKLEVFFQDQPSQVRKIYRAITDLSARSDVTMAQVKSTILPLLKGNNLLTDWFLQVFPMEKPPASLLNGTWENIGLSKDMDDTYENLIMPEVDDPYGGPNCICSCHSVEDVTFKARSRHCTPCGTKFMQGRVFLQTGKGLRPAKISFNDMTIDHKARLAGSQKKRSDASPTKMISPGKDSQDETRQSSDEEPEKKQQRLLKTAKKRKPKKKAIETHSKCTQEESPVAETGTGTAMIVVHDSPIRGCEAAEREEEALVAHPSGTNVDVVDVTPMLMAEEPQEWDCNTSMDSGEIRQSPEPCQSAESESECCEEFETSQDNNSDSDVSGNDADATNSRPVLQPWTREEDKVILETFQKEEVIDTAYKRILEQLSNRTLEQVKLRFDVLINFLKKMRDNR